MLPQLFINVNEMNKQPKLYTHTKPSGNCKVVHKLCKTFYIPHFTDLDVNLLSLQNCHYDANRPKQSRTARFVGYIMLSYN